jgi:hypothetical protein
MPTGELRPRIKCGAVKLTSDRAMQTNTNLLLPCWNRKPRLREPLSCCLVLCGLGVRVSPHRALGAPSPRCAWCRPRYAENPGPGLCFLPPPPKFPGGDMESCLLCAPRVAPLHKEAPRFRPVVSRFAIYEFELQRALQIIQFFNAPSHRATILTAIKTAQGPLAVGLFR